MTNGGGVLVRGGNMAVSEAVVQIRVSWETGYTVDACALVLADDGKVRGDDDFVFYNQPSNASRSVQLTPGSESSTVRVALSQLPHDVSRVVVAGSVDTGSFGALPNLGVAVLTERGQITASFRIVDVEPVTAMVFGELYRRGEGWKFRAVGQGWAAGLAGLATDFGIDIADGDDPPASAPVPTQRTAPVTPTLQPRPDWYPDPGNASLLRWWNGTGWTQDTVQRVMETAAMCGRCGGAKPPAMYSGAPTSCPRCAHEINHVLGIWQQRAANVLATSGPEGPQWETLWVELRQQRVHESLGRQALHPLAVAHLQRILTFAFADNIIEQHEMDAFDSAVRQLGITDPAVDAMHAQMLRGLQLAQIQAGELPRLQQTELALDADELLHLVAPAVQIRQLTNSTRRNHGRLIVTDRKLRFLGDTGGVEMPWAKALEIRPEYSRVIIATTTARGAGIYEVDDPLYVAAVLSGALKVSKRLIVVTERRDTRTIPQWMKTQVWQRDGGKCVECGATEYLEFDHEIPWSRGGATSVNNLRLLCRRCNLAKGARL